jgi:hypothetical protein
VFPETLCASCPRRTHGLGPPCPAQATGHRRFCDLAAAGDHRYDAFLVGPAEAPALPNLAAQAIGFVVAAARHLLAGAPEASPELVAARLAVCEGCDHLIRPARRCGLLAGTGCGCYVDKKAAWLEQTCPAGKWPIP